MRKESGALLALEDGTIFNGVSHGFKGNVVGEIVFNTGMTGYQEIITDPSYHGQIVVFTSPHIGNVGTNPQDNESQSHGVRAIVARSIESEFSNWRGSSSLPQFLKQKKIPAISNVDTRKLTRIIRDKGLCKACIMTTNIDPEKAIKLAREYDENSTCFVPQLSLDRQFISTSTLNNYFNVATDSSLSCRIAVYDFGIKRSILQKVLQNGASIEIIRSGGKITKEDVVNFDGYILSNGPGDPNLYKQEIEIVRKLIQYNKPILGICLGSQLLALAMGAKIKKLRFGHHGINHPVIDTKNNKAFIVSQNHNYVIDKQGLSDNFIITHYSLFDNTIQGFRIKNTNIFGFQGHPEGGPGPSDLDHIFSQFLTLCSRNQSNIKEAV